jgi:ubiquinone/menaquinone biosynthesis C-methylase UbiE
MSKEQATYSHGHHSSVVRSHARRTAANSAAFLLPHIKPNHAILDLGCGPGSITVDLAALVPEGSVIGGDAVADVLKQGESLANERGLNNITWQTVDGNNLPFEDNSFDIVFAHQTLQHVKDPVTVLKEMRRVVKPGGIVAARDADYRSFSWYPEPKAIGDWAALYQKIAKANGGEPNAGKYLQSWAWEAGFPPKQVTLTWTCWLYQDNGDAQAWGESWSGRAIHSGFAETAKKHGLADDAKLQEISQAWKDWGQTKGAFIMVPNGEILCTK